MKHIRPVGRQAASRKYDILTALGAFACAGDKHLQRLVLRFMTLIVARYNWQADELSIGQAEIAMLWSVDARTVKREMARLREMGWLVQKRAAARGRVAAHGVDLECILRVTRPHWQAIGSDFVARLQAPDSGPDAPPGNIVAFPRATPVALPEGAAPWDRVLARLSAEDPALYATWFASLRLREAQGGGHVLIAPSRFHATFVSTHYLGRLIAAMRMEGIGAGNVVIFAP
ncbi:MAG: DnaA N-terminal domain-containing protein [Paracoccaceae bacterium]